MEQNSTAALPGHTKDVSVLFADNGQIFVDEHPGYGSPVTGGAIFADGFEAGNTSVWITTVE